MTTTRTSFRIHSVPESVFEEARATRRDALGNAVVDVTAGGGEPLRCCLRDAEAGEQLILLGYALPLPASPYRETGPIFGHAERCDGPPPADVYPPAWRDRAQIVRGYDERGWIHAAAKHDGLNAEAAIEELLADPAVVQVHSRNVTYGCFMFRVTRES